MRPTCPSRASPPPLLRSHPPPLLPSPALPAAAAHMDRSSHRAVWPLPQAPRPGARPRRRRRRRRAARARWRRLEGAAAHVYGGVGAAPMRRPLWPATLARARATACSPLPVPLLLPLVLVPTALTSDCRCCLSRLDCRCFVLNVETGDGFLCEQRLSRRCARVHGRQKMATKSAPSLSRHSQWLIDQKQELESPTGRV